MPSFEHKIIKNSIANLDMRPPDSQEFLEWIKAQAHLDLLNKNANDDEIIMSANGGYTFVYTALISNERLSSLDKEDLFEWDGNLYSSAATYGFGGDRHDVWVERGNHSRFSGGSSGIKQMVFMRTIEGAKDDDRRYFEINQDYAHVTGIHWRTEHDSFIRYDENGDISHVVSATYDQKSGISLVTFQREPLEEFLAATGSSLIRRFDFSLIGKNFTQWSDGPERLIEENKNLFYRQKIDGNSAYTYGVQIISFNRDKSEIFKQIKNSFSGRRSNEYENFIIHDMRNERVLKVSTNPLDTTNYFKAKHNSLPFELSPAFFRPEVLQKYKSDSDKYILSEREIKCRGSWNLTLYDINEAGQVHAYICYLRRLPYLEQKYWASFNEKPKAIISKRALNNDLLGKFTDESTPLGKVLRIVNVWDQRKVSWWELKDKDLLRRVHLPITSNKDEWATAFLNLSKLIIEGFSEKKIKSKLDEQEITYDNIQGVSISISLLEKLIYKGNDKMKLDSLRTIQRIRSKTIAHSNVDEARELEKNAKRNHGTFREHFEHVCTQLVNELQLIEKQFPDPKSKK